MEKEAIKETIKTFTEKNKPLLLVTLFGGYKNPSTELTRPDFAETKTLKRLNDLLNKLRAIYPFGAELRIITTGKKGELSNEISPKQTLVYERLICGIAKNFKGIKVIPIGLLYGKFFKNGDLEEAVSEGKRRAKIWNNDKDLSEKLKIAFKHNPHLDVNSEENIKKAMESTMVYLTLSSKEPEIMANEFKNFIKLSFRTKGEMNAISLFTCRKGMQKQPWNNKCKGCQHEQRCFAESKSGKILYI